MGAKSFRGIEALRDLKDMGVTLMTLCQHWEQRCTDNDLINNVMIIST
jgi:hypothetical protein